MSEIDRALALSWEQAWLTVVVATGVYLAVVVLSRLFGQRQFSTTSSYDLAFVFALGGVIGRVILVRTSLADAVLGLATMFVLHAASGWLLRHSALVHRFSQNRPVLLVADGRLLDEGMKAAKMSAAELRQQLRLAGHASLRDLHAVILERDGRISVVGTNRKVDLEFLSDVRGAEHLSSGVGA